AKRHERCVVEARIEPPAAATTTLRAAVIHPQASAESRPVSTWESGRSSTRTDGWQAVGLSDTSLALVSSSPACEGASPPSIPRESASRSMLMPHLPRPAPAARRDYAPRDRPAAR